MYFPTQRLRIKVDDSNSLLKNYQGNKFGIVSKNKDMSYRNTGVLVSIVKEESFIERSPFIRNYTDFVVECNRRIKILKDSKYYCLIELSTKFTVIL